MSNYCVIKPFLSLGSVYSLFSFYRQGKRHGAEELVCPLQIRKFKMSLKLSNKLKTLWLSYVLLVVNTNVICHGQQAVLHIVFIWVQTKKVIMTNLYQKHLAITDVVIFQPIKGIIMSIPIYCAHCRTWIIRAIEHPPPTNTIER